MSEKDLAIWRVFDAIHPFSDVRGDMQAGIVANAIREVAMGRNSGSRPLGDYVIEGEPPSELRKKRRAERRTKHKKRNIGLDLAEGLGLRVHPWPANSAPSTSA